MKRFTLISLSILCLSLAATPSVNAATRTAGLVQSTTAIANNATTSKITPFALVQLAYQGEYRQQDIPGFSSLLSAYANKTITAKDLVNAAIKTKQLTPDYQTNNRYLYAVDLQLLAIQN